MDFIRRFIRYLFSPVTIMIISHNITKTHRVKLPSLAVTLLIISSVMAAPYFLSTGISSSKYDDLKSRFDYYRDQFVDLSSTISSLKDSEEKFKALFAHGSKKAVLGQINKTESFIDTGSLELDSVKRQILEAFQSAGQIKDYLKEQNSLAFATPSGSPVDSGRITSKYGWRTHPLSQKQKFHTGIDIAVSAGTPVRATANGIVSYSDWLGGSGKLIVIEHGLSFTTCFAHNKKLVVNAGDKVKRGDIIAYAGSTGYATGPHVHYEVWQDNQPVNPITFMVVEGDDDV